MYRELKGVSQFIDYHLQPYVEILPSFIKDTMDFLLKHNQYKLKNWLVTLHVSSLYTSIPLKEGL